MNLPKIILSREFDKRIWMGYSLDERREALQNLEDQHRLSQFLLQQNQTNELGSRPESRVIIDEELNDYEYGYFDGDIHVNKSIVESDDPTEAVGTVIHEGRHAYQKYAVEHPEIEPDKELLTSLEENRKHYVQPGDTVDFEEYANQPMEADAEAYEKAQLKHLGLSEEKLQGETLENPQEPSPETKKMVEDLQSRGRNAVQSQTEDNNEDQGYGMGY